MTLYELADFCSQAVGIADNITRDQAKTFIRHRWRMLWGSRTWKQALVTHTQSVPAGTHEVTLTDPILDRMINARWGESQALEGVAPDLAFRTDPRAWDQQGQIVGYTEWQKAADGLLVIRLMYAPIETKDLLCLCKRKCPELLTDSSVPQLTAVDQALMAYGQGDLYRWLRQFSKANQLFEEGAAHVAQMISIDTDQSATSQRLVPGGSADAYPGAAPWE
ncbi:MAG: hypothetical protein JSS23_12320 [Proteobacteria bacterium]|nr:hypothetical protein [Pseudomonadota bacterium]